MITCRQLSDFLDDYLSGELDETSRSEFDRHLAVCPTCVRYVQTYRQTISLGKAAFADDGAPVPQSVPQELVKAILARAPKK